MKFTKLFAAVMAIATIATACQEPEAPALNNGKEIAVSAQMYNFTRATDTAFEEGDAIGLHIVTDATYLNNAKYTYTGGALVGATTNYWYDDETVTADVLAYYPYSAEATYKAEGYNFAVKADQSVEGAYAASDLLIAATTSKPTEEAVTLPFRHALSKINVKINNASKEVIKDVYVANVYTAATFDLKAGTATVSGEVGTVKAAKAGEGWTMIVVPQEAATPKMIVTTESNRQYTFNIVAATDLAAGKVATANLTISKDLVATEFSPEISDWETNEDLEFNPGEENKPGEGEGDVEDPFLTEESEWALYGAWESEAWTDMFFYTTPTEGVVVAENVVFTTDAQPFLVRKPSTEWADKYAAGSVNYLQANKYVATAKDGIDLRVEKAGTYDIYFNTKTYVLYMMADDADYATAIEQTSNGIAPDTSNMSWGLVGEFTGWGNDAPDVALEWDGTIAMYVAKGVALSGQFKVRADKAWTDSFGSGTAVTVDDANATTVCYNGANCSVVEGTYDVYFWYNTSDITAPGKMWVKTAGAAAPSL